MPLLGLYIQHNGFYMEKEENGDQCSDGFSPPHEFLTSSLLIISIIYILPLIHTEKKTRIVAGKGKI